MNEFTAFVTAMISLSMGVERIVEILKGMLPALNHHDTVIHALAALCGMFVAYLVGPHAFLAVIPESGPRAIAGAALLGLMASVGSAFWNHLLDILGAIKTVRERNAAQSDRTERPIASP